MEQLPNNIGKARSQQIISYAVCVLAFPCLILLLMLPPKLVWLHVCLGGLIGTAIAVILYWIHVFQKTMVCSHCNKRLSGLLKTATDPNTRSSFFVIVPPKEEIKKIFEKCPYCGQEIFPND